MPTQKKVDGTVGMRSFTDDSLCLLDVSVGDSHGAPSIAITVSPSILPYAIFPSAWNRHHLVLIGPSFNEVALGRVFAVMQRVSARTSFSHRSREGLLH